MIRKIVYSLILSFLFLHLASAQDGRDSLVMNINLKFGVKPLELDKYYVSKNLDTLQVNSLKFYISKILIQYSDKTIYSQINSYHLIDIENFKSLRIPICKNKNLPIEKISFHIGIDSLTSVSGALSGDLDPTNGMYWAWQSGYINMKLEGKSSSCKTRKNEFQFHIGGYMKPNYAMRKVALEPKRNNSTLEISVDLAELFSQIELSKTNSIMIPGKQAMEIADYSIKMFKTE